MRNNHKYEDECQKVRCKKTWYLVYTELRANLAEFVHRLDVDVRKILRITQQLGMIIQKDKSEFKSSAKSEVSKVWVNLRESEVWYEF